MRFKVDENLPVEVAELLTMAAHDAVTVMAQRLQGKADTTIVDACRREGRVLVTLDRDFTNAQAYPPNQLPGLVVLCPHRQDKNRVLKLVQRALPLLSQEAVEHRLWIVEETRVRIRE